MAAPVPTNSGTQFVTADIAVATSGATTRVYSIHIISTGGGAAVVSLRNGTSAGDTAWITETGTVSTGKTIPLGTYGVLFPNGCFVDVDANTASVAVNYQQ